MDSTKVDNLYKEFLKAGMSKKDAAKQTQERTGYSVVTGKPIKQKQLQFTRGRIVYGQYGIKK